MGKSPIRLNINNQAKFADEITYEDLLILYEQFIKRNHQIPRLVDCKSSNNLPQAKMVKKILNDNNIRYNDFMLKFNRTSHNRTTVIEDYNYYVERFKSLCKNKNHTITRDELKNNEYGLPGDQWFVKYCPDKNVNSYKKFIEWCGLKETKYIWTKEEVCERLIQLQNDLDRPIVKSDITIKNVGFSNIVVNRLYGNFTKAKEEIGLWSTEKYSGLPFEYYQKVLTDIIQNYKNKEQKDYITWADIESRKYSNLKINHKTYIIAFEKANVDLYAYIKSLGCCLNPTAFSYSYIFDDGEKIDSNMEYEFSNFLRKQGYVYKKDYFRAVKYKTFSNIKSKINCDYVIILNNIPIYIEIAGIIDGYDGEWKTHNYSTKLANNYKDKMILKEKILSDSHLDYLFLFKDDMKSQKYKDIFKSFITAKIFVKGGINDV